MMIGKTIKMALRAAANLVAGRHWSQQSMKDKPSRTRWWESPTVVRHVNETICGTPLDAVGAATVELIKKKYPGRIFHRAVSIGCGHGSREMMLVTSGIVAEFHLFELSPVRVAHARENARKLGIENRIILHNSDGLKHSPAKQYDLVHWAGSLHHMPSAHEAIMWSHKALAPGGVFFMDDFVGPTRMQWSDRMLRMASRVRAALPEKYMKDPHLPERMLRRDVVRPKLWRMYLSDPTECADSAAIIPSLQEIFPNIDITPTGGAIYHLALNDILHNIDEVDDRALLDKILSIDDLCARIGEFHYAVAIAERH